MPQTELIVVEPEEPIEPELTPFQQVWKYISNTPENINPAILKQIIEKVYNINTPLVEDSGGNSSAEEPVKSIGK